MIETGFKIGAKIWLWNQITGWKSNGSFKVGQGVCYFIINVLILIVLLIL